MDRKTAARMLDLIKKTSEDPEYHMLMEELLQLDTRMLRLFDDLPAAQAGLIADYIGLLGEMHRKMLEIACR